MSDWITDRRPTEADADEKGVVIVWAGKFWQGRHFEKVRDEPWMSPPKPYQPPPPDTSLAASERLIRDSVVFVDFNDDEVAAFDRILETARKWDAVANQGKCVQGFTAEEANAVLDDLVQESERLGLYGGNDPDGVGENAGIKCDNPSGPCACGAWHNNPDGVGEGWRLLTKNECPDAMLGDQVETFSIGKWTGTAYDGKKPLSEIKSKRRYRRRIDADRPKSVLAIAKETGMETSGVKSQRDIVDVETGKRMIDDKPTENRERREYWYYGYTLYSDPHLGTTPGFVTSNDVPERRVHLREVLPGDPDQEWVEELVRLCESIPMRVATESEPVRKITNHLAKRGE